MVRITLQLAFSRNTKLPFYNTSREVVDIHMMHHDGIDID